MKYKSIILILSIGFFCSNLFAQTQDTIVKKKQMFSNYQLHEYGIVIISILALLAGLSVLFFYVRHKKKKNEPEEVPANEVKAEVVVNEEIEGEIHAAIGLALHLHNREVHDFENLILTINRVSRNYSPWSSKIYSLREWPNRR